MARIYPTSHFLTITQGAFLKALGFGALAPTVLPLVLAIPLLLALSVVALPSQESCARRWQHVHVGHQGALESDP